MLVTQRNFTSGMEHIAKVPNWTLDCETTGLGMKDRICGIAIRAAKKSRYFPFRHKKGSNLDERQLGMLLHEAANHTLSGFNLAGFDTRMCRRDGMLWADVRDVMMKAFLVNENEPRNSGYGLEALANRYLGEEHTTQQRELNHILVSNLLTKGDICLLPAKTVAPYACEDVELSDKLDEFYEPHIEKQGLRDVWHGVSEYGQIVGLMCERGIPINTEQCEEELIRARCMVTETAMEVYQREGHVININSNPAAARWLGVSSTKEEDLQAMADSQPEVGWKVELLLKYRKLQRAISSYYGPMLTHAEEGRLHPSIALHGTVTGRPACWSGRGHMNVLALPRDTKTYRVKQCIEAPKGQLFIQADYRTAEMRLACHYGQEKRMAALLRAGKNIHRVTSDDLGMPYDSAKRVNFSVIYGIGARSLARNLHIQERVAARYLNAYHRRYPGFRRLYRDAERKARLHGRITMWTGRRRHYNRGPSVTPYHKASDHLIQGGVNELLRIKQTQLHHELPDVEQILQVYDSAIMLAPEDVAYERAEQVREIMTHDGFTLPMEVDMMIGKTLAKSENDT